MQKFLTNPKFMKTSIVALLVGGLLYAGSEPAHSGTTSSITLNGQASGILFLGGSSATDCTTSGGSGAGASWTTVPTEASPNGTFNFGTLSSGDGSALTAQLGLRIRANSPCHLTAVCNSANATVPASPNLTYQGADLTTGALLASAIGVSNSVTAATSGAQSSVAGYSTTGSAFAPGNDLADLTVGTAAATGDTKFCSFTSAPSTGGSVNSSNNYVTVFPQFVTNSGLSWGTSDGSASTAFSLGVVFGLFAN